MQKIRLGLAGILWILGAVLVLGACGGNGGDEPAVGSDGDQETADGDTERAENEAESLAASFRFVIISDTHVRLPGNPDDGNYDNQKNIDNLSAAVARINRDYSDADFVAVTGDMVGCNFSENPDDYGPDKDTPAQRFKTLTDALTMPLYATLGNHDYQKSYDPEIGEAISSSDRPAIEAVWKKVMGIEPYYSVVHKGVRLIFANSNRGGLYEKVCTGNSVEAGCSGSFDDEQIDWLNAELEKPEPAILFFHHPPKTEGKQYFSIASFLVGPDESFYPTVKEHKDKILGMFVGHGHFWAKDTLYGIPVYETGSVGDTGGNKDNLHIVEVDPARQTLSTTIGLPGGKYGF